MVIHICCANFSIKMCFSSLTSGINFNLSCKELVFHLINEELLFTRLCFQFYLLSNVVYTLNINVNVLRLLSYFYFILFLIKRLLSYFFELTQWSIIIGYCMSYEV